MARAATMRMTPSEMSDCTLIIALTRVVMGRESAGANDDALVNAM